MKSNRVRPIAWSVASLLVVALALVACAPNANELLISPNGVMPANYGEQLSTQELADLIAYLLQQNAASGS